MAHLLILTRMEQYREGDPKESRDRGGKSSGRTLFMRHNPHIAGVKKQKSGEVVWCFGKSFMGTRRIVM